ncbi:MAG: hypothetical protein ACR2LC_00755 [Pyrinomonadaceae bacterium]
MILENSSRKHVALALLTAISCGSFIFLFSAANNRRVAHRLSARPANSSSVHTSQAELGIKNVEKLLPRARRLTLESLQALAADYSIEPAELRIAARHIEEVQTIVLDENLGDKAEVNDDEPTEIRVGTSYARDLTTDAETMLLLGHELTHVAARGGNLSEFVERVARRAARLASVSPAESQREDLACDFIGEQTLRRLLKSSAINEETAAKQLARALDDDSGDADDANDDVDEEHLGQRVTFKALLALDPELRTLLHKSAL